MSDEDLRLADVEIQRPMIRRRVERLTGQGQLEEAADELRSYEASTGDRSAQILDLKVQLLEFQGNLDEALAVAEQGRVESARLGATRDFYTFTLHGARLRERQGLLEEASEQLHEALVQARSLRRADRSLGN